MVVDDGVVVIDAGCAAVVSGDVVGNGGSGGSITTVLGWFEMGRGSLLTSRRLFIVAMVRH